MDELVPADRYRHVRRSPRHGCKEQQIARNQRFARLDRCSQLELIANLPWQRQAVPGVDVLREAAAVEALGSVPPFR